MALTVVPSTLSEANAFVERHHRHYDIADRCRPVYTEVDHAE